MDNESPSSTIQASSAQRLAPLLLFLFAVLLYAPTLSFEWLAWDDDINITGNQRLQESSILEPETMVWMTQTDYVYQWRPLNWMLYYVQFAVFGLNPAGYHLLSILLHAGNAVLLYFLILKVVRIYKPEAQASIWLATLISALWAAHPLRVEVVAWVSAQAHLVTTGCLLIAYHLYLDAAFKQGSAARIRLLLALFCFVFAMLTYPSGIVFPAILILTDLLLLKRIGWSSCLYFWKGPGLRLILRITPFALVSLLVFWIFFFRDTEGSQFYDPGEYSLDRSMLIQLKGVVLLFGHYLEKTVFPFNLTAYYEDATFVSILSSAFLSSLIFCLIFIGLTGVIFRKNRYLLLFPSTYLLLNLPFLGLGSYYAISSDRYTYASSIVLFIGLYAFCRQLAIRQYHKVHLYLPRSQRLSPLLLLLVLALSSFKTLTYQQKWADTESLMTHMLEVNPDHYEQALFRSHLAIAVDAKGRTEEAIAILNSALEINPYSVRCLRYRAFFLRKLGYYEESQSDWELAQKIETLRKP